MSGFTNLIHYFKGYPTDGDKTEWRHFDEVFVKSHAEVIERYSRRLIEEFKMPPLPADALFYPSPYLNIYAYPQELDYLDIRPLPPKWQAFDYFIRQPENQNSKYELPEKLRNLNGKIVYVSMGSIGAFDERLLKRLIDILGQSPHRFLMALGPNHERLSPTLPANIYGEQTMPQIDILAGHAQLFITHGGNNSVIESMYYGVPMIISPMFSDQYDNAQRVTEKGYGQRINAYTCTPQQLLDLIEQVLADEAIGRRLAQCSSRLQSCHATDDVAQAIVQCATGEL